MAQLHVFCYGGCDWLIAADVDDAIAVFTEHTGEPPCDPSGIRLLDDETLLWVDVDAAGEVAEKGSDGATREFRSCRQWADRFGRRFLASTEC